MFMKKYAKIIIISLVFALALSFCSCSLVNSVSRDVKRINEFKDKVNEIANLGDTEEIIQKAEELLHPDSGLDKDTAYEKIKNDPDLKGIDLENLLKDGYSIGEFSDYNLKFNDANLGGNVYSLSVEVTAGGMTFTVNLSLLSDDVGIGIYDFDISK